MKTRREVAEKTSRGPTTLYTVTSDVTEEAKSAGEQQDENSKHEILSLRSTGATQLNLSELHGNC